MSHQAAFLPGVNKPLEVSSTPTPTPDETSVLVRVHAVAINPVDHIVQDTGFLLKEYPAILGSDAAGEIIEVGSTVTKFKKGDRVLIAPVYLISGKKEQAAFQEVIVAPQNTVAKIPDSMSFAHASVLPLALATASTGLYTKGGLAIPYPSFNPQPTGKKLLIWGGSSSVGSSVIQLAVASGLEVVVTASPKNFDYIKSLAKGTKCQIFDYNSPSIVGDLVDALGSNCVGAYDAITKRDTHLTIATVLAQLGGGKIVAVLKPPKDELPATIESYVVQAPDIFGPEKDVGNAIWNSFLPHVLETGQIVSAPGADIVGKGLDSIQNAMYLHKAGVSAKKLVVEL